MPTTAIGLLREADGLCETPPMQPAKPQSPNPRPLAAFAVGWLLAFSVAIPLLAQTPPANGPVPMQAEEYNAYTKGVQTTNPTAKVAAFEDYLRAYPNSAVKADALEQILYLDSQIGDEAATLNAADRVLQIDPNDLRALTFYVYYHRADANRLTDPTARAAALADVAAYAQRGLHAPRPANMSEPDFTALKKAALPIFQSAIADAALARKDNTAAIAALKAELDGVPVAQTQTVGPVLQDVYVLAQAYSTATPPDYPNCAWYATRAAFFAPEAFKPPMQQLATYCYTKSQGSAQGYAAMQAAVQTSLDPPPGFFPSNP